MQEFIDKKLKRAKVFRICLWVLLALFPFSIAALIVWGMAAYGWFSLLLMALVIGIPVYFAKCHPFTVCIKGLQEKGQETIADDIIPEETTYGRSKICCGKKAMLCKKPLLLLAYKEIAWVYLYERRVNFITVEKAVIIHTKDGRKCSIQADAEEFKWLMERYVLPHNPRLIVGYGRDQEEAYLAMNPMAKEKRKKTKRIWGIVLMAMGAAFLIAMLCNLKNAQLLPLTVIISGLFLSGGLLYWFGSK